MTFEEAKKILEKEGFYVEKATIPCVLNGWFTKYESPEICEAVQVVCSAGYKAMMFETAFQARKERLKKEYGKNHIKGDFSGNKSIEHCGEPAPGEEQPEENGLKAATDAFILQANEIMRLKKKNAGLLEAIDKMKEGNPALKESASQFNDALLDEQAKKIAELTKKNERLGKEIARLNKNIYKKNLKIEELRKESSRHLRGKIKMFGENVDLEQMLKDKNAVLSDVAEELRLTKIREKNLVEVSQKYLKENEELKNQLADKVIDEIDALALKSAESDLAYKEKVIADLTEELDETKKEMETFKESYKRRIKEDSEYFERIQKICNVGQQKWLIESEYLEKDKPFRFPKHDIASGKENKKPRIPTPEISEEKLMKFQEKVCADIAEEGGDQSATIVQCGNGITISKEEAEIVERCTKNGTELHYSEKDGLTYTNMYGEEIPIRCLRGLFHVFTDEELKNMKK